MSRRAASPYKRADSFTKAAKSQGYPARSVFKLEEIDRRVRLLRRGQHVLDLGAAPGSWTLYAADKVGPTGRVLAVDLQVITVPLSPQAKAVQGSALDLSNEDLALFGPYDVVLSDMAPSTTGDRMTDQARSQELFLRALDVAKALGKPGSSFVGKLFMGGELPEAKEGVRLAYDEVRLLRPDATRAQSFEVFLVGLGKKS